MKLRIVAASLVAAAGLGIVGWLDYSATRAELLRLLRDQAQSLRQTIAAAARSNDAAGAQAERQVSRAPPRQRTTARGTGPATRARPSPARPHRATQQAVPRGGVLGGRERANYRRREWVAVPAPGTASGRVGEGSLEAPCCNASSPATSRKSWDSCTVHGGAAALGWRPVFDERTAARSSSTPTRPRSKPCRNRCRSTASCVTLRQARRSWPTSRSIAAIFTSHTEHCQPPRALRDRGRPGSGNCRRNPGRRTPAGRGQRPGAGVCRADYDRRRRSRHAPPRLAPRRTASAPSAGCRLDWPCR